VIQRVFHLDFKNPVDRNIGFLVVEVFFAAVLGGALNFTGALVVRLGASNLEIGLLSSIPALLNVILSIPSARFLERHARRKPWILGSLLVYRSGFVLVALALLVGIKLIPLSTQVVGLIIFLNATLVLFNVGFTTMLADIIPDKRRVAVFSTRNIIASITSSVCIFLFGQWLTKVAFPWNYSILIIFGYLVSLLSISSLNKLQVPDSVPKPPSPPKRVSIKDSWNLLHKVVAEQPVFVRLTINTFILSFGLWVASPLYILYYVRSLKATDAWIGTMGLVANISVIGGYTLWQWLIPRLGELRTIKLAAVFQGLFPILVGLSPALTPILIAVGLNSILSPGFGLAHLNTLLKSMPEESRAQYFALYAAINNAGAFVSPLIGVAIASRVGLTPTLIGCGVVAMFGACSFLIWPVRLPEPKPA
jgi:MFS family permease